MTPQPPPKTTDTLIDSALAHLRTVEIPEGLEARILQGAQRHAASAPASPWLRKHREALRWTAVLGSALALLLAVTTLHRTHHAPAAVPSAASPTKLAKAVPNPLASPPAHTVRLRRSTPLQQRTPTRTPETVAVSYPAPPLPLTDQERLMLRIVHKGDPVQMAMLDPTQRAARTAAQKADFQQFFEPSPEGETK